jgi:hypothetical protein
MCKNSPRFRCRRQPLNPQQHRFSSIIKIPIIDIKNVQIKAIEITYKKIIKKNIKCNESMEKII